MANNVSIIKITHAETSATAADWFGVPSGKPREACLQAAAFLQAAAGGAKNISLQVSNSEASGVAATGTITIASGTGAVGATIGGTTVTVTWATSDTASATALAAAINANSTVNKWVSATSNAGVVTLTAIEKSALGNNVTLVASGTGVTVSGAKLTGGVAVAYTSYTLGL